MSKPQISKFLFFHTAVIAPVPLLDSPVIHFLLPQRREMNRKLGYCQALNGKAVALETQCRCRYGCEFSLKCHSVPQSSTYLTRLGEKRGAVDWANNTDTSAQFMFEWDIHFFAVRLPGLYTLLFTCTWNERGFFTFPDVNLF